MTEQLSQCKMAKLPRGSTCKLYLTKLDKVITDGHRMTAIPPRKQTRVTSNGHLVTAATTSNKNETDLFEAELLSRKYKLVQ